MTLRFGLHLTTAHELEDGRELVLRAEELGFDDISFHDALLFRPPWPVLADFAGETRRVRLGPSVSNPFVQHPAVLAENAAHLDEISGGRAFLGLGSGSHFDLVGLDPQRRLRALEEAVAIVRHLTAGPGGAFDGEIFSLGAGASLRFGERREIPVHLGVFGPMATRLAGRIADGIRPAGQWDPAFMVQLREWIGEGASQVDRDPDDVELVVQNWTCLSPDREEARVISRRLLAVRLPSLGPMIEFHGIPDEEVDAARAANAGDPSRLDAISDATVDRFMAVGDAEDLRRGLDRIEEAGFSSVSFSGSLGPDPQVALTMIGDEIARRRAADSA